MTRRGRSRRELVILAAIVVGLAVVLPSSVVLYRASLRSTACEIERPLTTVELWTPIVLLNVPYNGSARVHLGPAEPYYYSTSGSLHLTSSPVEAVGSAIDELLLFRTPGPVGVFLPLNWTVYAVGNHTAPGTGGVPCDRSAVALASSGGSPFPPLTTVELPISDPTSDVGVPSSLPGHPSARFDISQPTNATGDPQGTSIVWNCMGQPWQWLGTNVRVSIPLFLPVPGLVGASGVWVNLTWGAGTTVGHPLEFSFGDGNYLTWGIDGRGSGGMFGPGLQAFSWSTCTPDEAHGAGETELF